MTLLGDIHGQLNSSRTLNSKFRIQKNTNQIRKNLYRVIFHRFAVSLAPLYLYKALVRAIFSNNGHSNEDGYTRNRRARHAHTCPRSLVEIRTTGSDGCDSPAPSGVALVVGLARQRVRHGSELVLDDVEDEIAIDAEVLVDHHVAQSGDRGPGDLRRLRSAGGPV